MFELLVLLNGSLYDLEPRRSQTRLFDSPANCWKAIPESMPKQTYASFSTVRFLLEQTIRNINEHRLINFL
jgi:hypothetical protein